MIKQFGENTYWIEDYGSKGRLKILVKEPRDLFEKESLDFLWPSTKVFEISEQSILEAMSAGKLYRINSAHKEYPQWIASFGNNAEGMPNEKPSKESRKRVHVLGLGDVGSTMALALCLYGKGSISEIGLYDLDPNRVKRWLFELNQIAEPIQDELPKVYAVTEENMFDCDLFAFTASVGVPPVNITQGDVRLVQFAGNSKLAGQYADLAVKAGYKGIFAIVSDPVDQLARHAYEWSNTDEEGLWHGRGLTPEQVRGYGLGVMNGRAAYYAKADGLDFNLNGRVYGPHGEGLVVANDWREGKYDKNISAKWTEATMTANLKMREIGYKPYIAPAVASGAISIVKTLTGEKQYSCISFDGFYYGCLNQRIDGMDIPERLESAEALKDKIRASAEEMVNQWQKLR